MTIEPASRYQTLNEEWLVVEQVAGGCVDNMSFRLGNGNRIVY